MKIIPNPASQRTFGENISIHLNKQINGIQKIVYSNDTSVFLGTMNPDGTEWTTKKIIDTMYSVQLADIYNDKIYIYIGNLYIFDSEGNTLSVAEMTIGVGSGEYFDFNNSKIYGWTRNSNYYVSVNSINFDGSGYETHQITTRTFSSYFYFQRLGNKLVYFYVVSGIRLYTAISDLDCSNFVGVDSTLRPTGYGIAISNGTTAYLGFHTIGIGLQLGMIDINGNFTYANLPVSGQYTYYHPFFKDSYIYQVTLGGDTEVIVYTAKCDLSGNILSEDEFIISDYLYNDLFVDPYDDGNIYAWQQYDEITYLINLWTYPGDYIEPPTYGYPWPKFQSNIEHTGYSNNSVTILSNPSFTWKYNITNDDLFSDIVIDADNVIYFGTKYGKVIALNSDGSLKWECDLSWEDTDYEGNIVIIKPDLHYGCPAIATDGTIYVASGSERDNDVYNGSSRLFAVNSNGTLKWEYYVMSVHYTKPSPITIANDGTILFSSYYPYAINPDGTLKWINGHSYTFSSPILYNNYVYALGTAGGMYVNDLETGDTILDWINVTGSSQIQPIIGNSIYAGSPLKSINLLTGVTEWEYNLTSINPNSISYGSNNTIYFCKGLNIYALNIDGTLKWTYLLSESSVYGNIVIDYNNNIYFITYYNDGIANKNKLYCLDSDGNLIYEKILNDTIGYCNLAIGGDGYLYGSNQGYIVKIGDYIPPIPLPQVQCRATQIIASANTGKIILSVPIL